MSLLNAIGFNVVYFLLPINLHIDSFGHIFLRMILKNNLNYYNLKDMGLQEASTWSWSSVPISGSISRLMSSYLCSQHGIMQNPSRFSGSIDLSLNAVNYFVTFGKSMKCFLPSRLSFVQPEKYNSHITGSARTQK